MSQNQLAELLYRSCGIQASPSKRDDRPRRAYPSGGGLYPLRVYLLIHSCGELAPGLFLYNAYQHSLASVVPWNERVSGLQRDAQMAAGMKAPPPIVITISSRFRRTAWKYEGIAYRLMLLEAGALMQTVSLVAGSMGLASCFLGCGNADLFTELTGTDYYMETSIAEMLVSAEGTSHD